MTYTDAPAIDTDYVISVLAQANKHVTRDEAASIARQAGLDVEIRRRSFVADAILRAHESHYIRSNYGRHRACENAERAVR